MKVSKKLTQKRLKELLHYDTDTGIFTWLVNKSASARVDNIAGDKDFHGYIIIGIDHERYKAHRLAWLYVHGYFPENQVDHIDRVKHHNWIKNLREVTQVCNTRNSKTPSTNTSGVKGVSWHKRDKKWTAAIRTPEKKCYLGYFLDFDEAVLFRFAAEQCLDWNVCDASSSAYKYAIKHKLIKEIT